MWKNYFRHFVSVEKHLLFAQNVWQFICFWFMVIFYLFLRTVVQKWLNFLIMATWPLWYLAEDVRVWFVLTLSDHGKYLLLFLNHAATWSSALGVIIICLIKLITITAFLVQYIIWLRGWFLAESHKNLVAILSWYDWNIHLLKKIKQLNYQISKRNQGKISSGKQKS